jgi:hypothetical protein
MIDGDECGAVRGMRIGRGDQSTWREPAPVPLCPTQIPHDLTWDGTWAITVGGQRLTAWAMSRPSCWVEICISLHFCQGIWPWKVCHRHVSVSFHQSSSLGSSFMPWDMYAYPHPSDLGLHCGQTHIKCWTWLRTARCKTILVSAYSTEVCCHATEASPYCCCFINIPHLAKARYYGCNGTYQYGQVTATLFSKNILWFYYFFSETLVQADHYYCLFKKISLYFQYLCRDLFPSKWNTIWTMPWLWLLVACFPLQQPSFDSRSGRVWYVVDNVTCEWVFFLST